MVFKMHLQAAIVQARTLAGAFQHRALRITQISFRFCSYFVQISFRFPNQFSELGFLRVSFRFCSDFVQILFRFRSDFVQISPVENARTRSVIGSADARSNSPENTECARAARGASFRTSSERERGGHRHNDWTAVGCMEMFASPGRTR